MYFPNKIVDFASRLIKGRTHHRALQKSIITSTPCNTRTKPNQSIISTNVTACVFSGLPSPRRLNLEKMECFRTSDLKKRRTVLYENMVTFSFQDTVTSSVKNVAKNEKTSFELKSCKLKSLSQKRAQKPRVVGEKPTVSGIQRSKTV